MLELEEAAPATGGVDEGSIRAATVLRAATGPDLLPFAMEVAGLIRALPGLRFFPCRRLGYPLGFRHRDLTFEVAPEAAPSPAEVATMIGADLEGVDGPVEMAALGEPVGVGTWEIIDCEGLWLRFVQRCETNAVLISVDYCFRRAPEGPEVEANHALA